MAKDSDFTYATQGAKTYDHYLEDEQARQQKNANQYAADANAANEGYKQTVDALTAASVAAQENAAQYDLKKSNASYRSQFDANAAQQLAQERRLKEQMANYGLGQSGYNATNQAALQLSRANADAATRTAKQQAADAITQQMQQFKADAQLQAMKDKAQGDYDTQQAILNARREFLTRAEENARQQQQFDTSNAQWQKEFDTSNAQWQKEFDLTLAQDARNQEQQQWENQNTMQQLLNNHNANIYSLISRALESGNTALATEYSKQLVSLGQDGTWQNGANLDVSGAVSFVNEQTENDRKIEESKAQAELLKAQAAANKESGSTETQDKAEQINVYGFRQKFVEPLKEAKKMVYAKKTEDAMEYLYRLIEVSARYGNPLSEDEVDSMGYYIGLSSDAWKRYRAEMELPDKDALEKKQKLQLKQEADGKR